MKEDSLYLGFIIFAAIGVEAICGIIHSSLDLIVKRAFFITYMSEVYADSNPARLNKTCVIVPQCRKLTTGKLKARANKHMNEKIKGLVAYLMPKWPGYGSAYFA